MITAAQARDLQETLGKNLKEAYSEIRKSALLGELNISFYSDIYSVSELDILCAYLLELGYKAHFTEEKHGKMIHIDWGSNE